MSLLYNNHRQQIIWNCNVFEADRKFTYFIFLKSFTDSRSRVVIASHHVHWFAPLKESVSSVVLESIMFHAASGLNYDSMLKLVASTSFHWSCESLSKYFAVGVVVLRRTAEGPDFCCDLSPLSGFSTKIWNFSQTHLSLPIYLGNTFEFSSPNISEVNMSVNMEPITLNYG